MKNRKASLAHKCARLVDLIGRSKVRHEKVDNRVTGCQNFGRKSVVGSFYGSLPFAEPGIEVASIKELGREARKDRGRAVL